ncbi:MAG TPA: hypothetical protein VF691_13790 [Cytophagaceae bacterium]|jgi:hypothetical protein
MKKELREEIKNGKVKKNSNLTKLIQDNKGTIKALGIASFVALAGISTAKLLQDKKIMKKLKKGLKMPKSFKTIEDFLALKKGEENNEGKGRPAARKKKAPAKNGETIA